jgi:hypothetical protein
MSSKVPKHSSSETPRSAMAAGTAAAISTPLDDAVVEKWSPKRNQRTAIKVVSLEDGNIRAGHWILTKTGKAVTISFLWKNSTGKIYGLTTGHSFALGDRVCVFLHSEPRETTESRCYEIKEIGEVVSKDLVTDSIVFEVTCIRTKDRFDFLKLASNSGLGDRELLLPRPSLNPSLPVEDSKVYICGAMTRGNCCTVSTPRNGDDEVWLAKRAANLAERAAEETGPSSDAPNKDLGDSPEDEIGFEEGSHPTVRATADGDCGALYLDLVSGVPVAVHHAMTVFDFPGTDEPDEFESYGFPLSLIMAKHPEQFDAEMFGTIEPAAQEGTITPVQQPGALGRRHQGARTTTSFQIKNFPVTIPENPVIPENPAFVGVGNRKAGDSTTTSSRNHDRKANRDAKKRARKEVVRCHQIQHFDVIT